jgi:serine protease AprX
MFRRRSLLGAVLLLVLAATTWPAQAFAESAKPKASVNAQTNIDPALESRAKHAGWSKVIVTLKPGAQIGAEVSKLGGRHGRKLNLINAMVIELPNGQIKKLAASPAVARLDLDRPTKASMARVANLIGARYARYAYGYDGAGIGVAVIDSGITTWHDDLTYTGSNSAVRVQGNQRVTAFVDFVNGATSTYDDYGHGTHVAGIIGGNGYDSFGSRAGIAPGAHLIGLKVLDNQGRGVISDVIAALEYAVANRTAQNIRVINLSVGASVTTSYNVDPLALAAKRAVDAGIVVVAAAGNLGRKASGEAQYGGITAPGNAPWVLTVGASTHEGTLNRTDDHHASYSSRGPTAVDFGAKPDILAPGTGVVSLTSFQSTFYTTKTAFLLAGNVPTPYKPYLSLSGTSMAAPVVAGTVALMLQANPTLTPNLVKAILQYTAQVQPGVDYMTQGGGFINAKGAVDLARYFRTAQSGSRYPANYNWSKAITWGNHRVVKGAISPFGNAWQLGVTWGSAEDTEGDNVVWGTACPDDNCFNVVWGTAAEGDNVVWGTSAEGDNVVWGTDCGEENPNCFNVVWGTATEACDPNTDPDCDGDNVVWGTNVEGDNVVWGTACDGEDCFNVVWGTDCEGENCYNVVWGTNEDCDPNLDPDCEGDNVVWGTDDGDCDPNADPECDGDNVVWGTTGECDPNTDPECDGDNVVWGTSGDDCDPNLDPNCAGDNVVWGTSVVSLLSYYSLLLADITNEYSWQQLFSPPYTTQYYNYSTFYPVLYTYVFYGNGGAF